MGTGAMAEMKIYPYHSAANYCPSGLQPITMNGVICCGTPNTTQSYQQMMAHPMPKKKTHKASYHRSARAVDTCPEGQKGCY
jgi:hypothetical protein